MPAPPKHPQRWSQQGAGSGAGSQQGLEVPPDNSRWQWHIAGREPAPGSSSGCQRGSCCRAGTGAWVWPPDVVRTWWPGPGGQKDWLCLPSDTSWPTASLEALVSTLPCLDSSWGYVCVWQGTDRESFTCVTQPHSCAVGTHPTPRFVSCVHIWQTCVSGATQMCVKHDLPFVLLECSHISLRTCSHVHALRSTQAAFTHATCVSPSVGSGTTWQAPEKLRVLGLLRPTTWMLREGREV